MLLHIVCDMIHEDYAYHVKNVGEALRGRRAQSPMGRRPKHTD
jgi:hypothetical protein